MGVGRGGWVLGLGLGSGVRPGSELGAGSAAGFEARLAQVRVDDRVEEGEGVLVLDRVRVGVRVRVTLTLTLALALALTFWKQPCRSQARQRPATPPLPLTCESGRSE